MFVVHCRIKPGGALNVLDALILKKIRSGQSVNVIFTLYSDRDYLEITDYEGRIMNNTVTLRNEGSSKKQNNGGIDGLDSSLHSEGQVIQIPIVTALPKWLNRLFRRADDTKPRFISSIIDYRNLMPFFPELMNILSWKLKRESKKYKVESKKIIQNSKFKIHNSTILISSYTVAKNIDIPVGYTTELYMHHPMQYIWTLYDDYVASFSGWKKKVFERVTPRLRRRDQKERKFDYIMTNSYSTQQLCHEIYRRKKKDMNIVYPPIDPVFFEQGVALQPDRYFLYVGRLSIFAKHLDVIIELCNRHKVQLLIAGDGPDKEYLMSIAGPTIIFLGWIHSVDDKIKLLSRAQGMINISHESFGITTAEALLLGVPVFGYQGGATPELVDATSGILTSSITDQNKLDESFVQYLSISFDRQEIQKRAKKLLGDAQGFWSM